MPDTPEPFRVVVHVFRESDRQTARAALEGVQPGTTQEFDGLVEGWATRAVVEQLTKAKLLVERAPDAAAPPPAEPPPLSRRNKRTDVELKRVFATFKAAAPSPTAPPGGEDVYRVRLKGAMCEEWRRKLDELGVRVESYRSGTYQVFLSPDKLARVQALPFVAEVKRYDLLDTVTSEFLQSLERDETAADVADGVLASEPTPEQTRVFDVTLHRAEDLDTVRETIKSQPGVQVLDTSKKAIRFRIPVGDGFLSFVASLAEMPQVRTLSVFTPPKLLCDFARQLIGVEAINAAPPAPARWTGQGEVVGVCDSGIDDTHPDLADRVKEKVSFRGCGVDDTFGHGTHVAGIVAGTGKASEGKPHPAVRGIAPGAKLVVVGMTDATDVPQIPLDFAELLDVAVGKGASIVNLSLGSAVGGSYDQGSESIDAYVCKHPDVLVVVAAGNEGKAPDGRHLFNRIGSPASAKNVLTVGASVTSRGGIDFTWGQFRPVEFPKPKASDELAAGKPDFPAAISSRGPTDSESVKPDLLAPGTFILAPRAQHFQARLEWLAYAANPLYVHVGGSSMAAPCAAGAAAIVRQYLREQRNVATPSAALLKAILVTSVRRLPSLLDPGEKLVGYPDFDQGFGRLDLAEVLPHAGAPAKRQLLFVDVANDSPLALQSRQPPGAARRSARTYQATVPPGAVGSLTATLVWTDPPGNGLMNTLDLVVVTPAGSKVVGNPDQFFRREALFSDVPFDRHNNVQQVRFVAPVPDGDYFVRVIAQNTTAPPQGFALCVCGEIAGGLVEGP